MAGGSAPAQSARARIEDMLADELDRAHVSEDHLNIWFEDEGASFRKDPATRTNEERFLALSLISKATRRVGGTARFVVKAMHGFDNLPASATTGVPVLEQASAMWVLCKKADGFQSHESLMDGAVNLIVNVANAFAAEVHSVRGQQHRRPPSAQPQETSWGAITALERRILVAQEASLWPPTVADWFFAMSCRFDMATKQRCRRALDAVEQWGETVGALLLAKAPATAGCPPSVQAAGIFGLGLALAGLLPPATFRPRAPDPEEGARWEHACGALAAEPWSAPLLKVRAEVPASLPPDSICAALEFATMQTMASIRVGTQAALAATRNADNQPAQAPLAPRPRYDEI